MAASVLKQAPNTYTIKNYRKIHGRHYSILPDRSGKPELQPDKYNILMYYHLPVVLWLSKKNRKIRTCFVLSYCVGVLINTFHAFGSWSSSLFLHVPDKTKQTRTEIGRLFIDDVLENEQLSGVGGEDGDGVWRVVL